MATQLVPDTLNTAGARLPAAYEAAKQALAKCESLDECQGWANKAHALASYARQADDDTLEKQAIRIKSRAVRRCGELLHEIDGRGGDRSKGAGGDAPVPANDHVSPSSKSKRALTFAPTQREAAAAAGMSIHQERTAVRVAAVPAERFEAAVESDTPPSVTRLADMGRKAAAAPVHPGFNAAIQFAGHVRRLAEFAGGHDAATVAGGVADFNRRELRRHIAQCRRFLAAIVPSIREDRDGL